jgi:hypothetical protein
MGYKITEEFIKNKFKYLEMPVFECGDGWNKLIYDCTKEIAKIDKNKIIRVVQIKEKFGSLRYYYQEQNHPNHILSNKDYDKINGIIFKYEKISAKTCEMCGRKGKIKSVNGWLACLCPKCRDAETK